MVSSALAATGCSSSDQVSSFDSDGAEPTVSAPRSITPSSPACTSSRVPDVVVSATVPRTTCTEVSESVVVTTNFVPITPTMPDGVVIEAFTPSMCETSAESRPPAIVITRGCFASNASTVA